MDVDPFASPGDVQGTLLVVDDEEDILLSIGDVVETLLPGTRVLTAASGARALDVVRGERVDVVLSDYKMPGMDGIMLLREVAALAPAAPRVLMTAFPDPTLEARARAEAGIARMVQKPLDVEALVALLSDLLARRVSGGAGA